MDGGGKGWGELGPAEQCKAVAPDAQRSCYALKLSVVCVFVRNMNLWDWQGAVGLVVVQWVGRVVFTGTDFPFPWTLTPIFLT